MQGRLALGPQNVKTPRAACTGTKPQLLARYMGCRLMALTSLHSSRVPFGALLPPALFLPCLLP